MVSTLQRSGTTKKKEEDAVVPVADEKSDEKNYEVSKLSPHHESCREFTLFGQIRNIWSEGNGQSKMGA